MRYLIVTDPMEAREYEHLKGDAFDAFIYVNEGIQYLQARTAEFWLYTRRSWAAMSPEYLAALAERVAQHLQSEVMPLDTYLDHFHFQEH